MCAFLCVCISMVNETSDNSAYSAKIGPNHLKPFGLINSEKDIDCDKKTDIVLTFVGPGHVVRILIQRFF